MACPLLIPPGTIFGHNEVRIVFVEAIDDVVLRFFVEETQVEYFYEVAGVLVRLTVRSLLEEFAEGRLVRFGVDDQTLSEWQGRYLGLDRAGVLAKEPYAVLKYDIALAAIGKHLPLNAELLHEFACGFVSDPNCRIPSGRSTIRHIGILKRHDERIGALKNRSGRRKGASQLPPVLDRLVQQSVALYYSAEAMKKMDSHALVAGAWRQLKDHGVAGLGDKPPSKTTVVNRINACENKKTHFFKYGRDEADRHFLAAGVSEPVTRPFELVTMDGVEYEQVCHFSAEVMVATNKMKSVWLIDAFSLFVFPSTPFAGDYRPEMGMGAILGALEPPALDPEEMAKDPMQVLMFGKIGRLRCDNDRALIPPSAIGNLASVVTRVELAKKYGPDEKANIENFHKFLLGRLDGEPGTVLSARSRRRSIRRDPLAEAAMTRGSFCRRVEELRLEWNDTAHRGLGGRTPNELMREHIAMRGVPRTPPGEVRRYLARTVRGILTTDGVEYDTIRYKWNRAGVTEILSNNLAAQPFSGRLEGTARCEVWLRVYDWNLDFVEVLDEATNQFVTLWSDDPEYTEFLSRYEHKFYKSCASTGATGAQTPVERAIRRGQALTRAWRELPNMPFRDTKKAAAVLECAEVRAHAINLRDDPDLTNFDHLLIDTQLAGSNRVDVPSGPPQTRKSPQRERNRQVGGKTQAPVPDWASLEAAPRSNLQMLERDLEEDLDGGIDWDAAEGADPPDEEINEDGE